jgi:replicative DNA helicase
MLDEAESKIFAIAEEGARGAQGFQEIQPLLTQVVERIDELFNRDNASDITGVPTGFIDLDRMTSGLQPGDLIIVAGRPSMGKTAFSVNIGENVAIDSGLPVAVFSMEMGGTQLAMRMLGSVGRLDQHRLRTGRLNDEDWPRLTHAIQKMNDAQVFIDETPALNAIELRARARRLSRQCGKLGLIIIDYLQLMSATSAGENRATEISEISRSLKGLAKELNCPVIALSQLNRSLEQRPNKRPVMSDLRESGAIEQDADVILFIYRDEVYNPDSQDKGTAEIIIGKQRNGPIGTVRLTFLGQYTKFDNYAGGNAIFSGE